MIAKSMRSTVVAVVALVLIGVAVEVNAQCSSCGTAAYMPASYSSYYSGSYSAFYPATYQTTYSSSWYPGYWMDRMRTRLWGSPTTYVASYPTTFVASYAPTVASYAPTGCSTCSSCSTCGVQQVTMRPVCTTCASPCSTCDTCSTSSSDCSTCGNVVTQTSYQQPTCSTCGTATSVQSESISTTSSTRSPDPAPPQTFDSSAADGSTTQGSATTIDSNASVPMEREEKKPPVNDTEATQPTPGDDTTESEEARFYRDQSEGSDSSTLNEAPQLFDPNDNVAQRVLRPATTALYTKPASHRNVSTTTRVTAEQAHRDAIGWTSVSK